MNETTNTTSILKSAPPIEEQEKAPKNFLSRTFGEAKKQLGYLKYVLADRFDIAKKAYSEAEDKTPKKKENIFSDFSRDVLGGGLKEINKMIKAARGEVDVSEYSSWKEKIKRMKENANKNRVDLTAQSTPAILPSLRNKFDLMEQYKWTRFALPVIEKERIVNTAPEILPNGKIKLRRSGAGYEHGGRYFPYYDVIENAMQDWEEGKAKVSAHEFLHKFFRDGNVPVSKNYDGFNKDWEEIKENTKDPTVKRMLESIDHTLDTNPLYADLNNCSCGYANERFAFLGQEIGRQDYKGPAMNKLLKYYNNVFNLK